MKTGLRRVRKIRQKPFLRLHLGECKLIVEQINFPSKSTSIPHPPFCGFLRQFCTKKESLSISELSDQSVCQFLFGSSFVFFFEKKPRGRTDKTDRFISLIGLSVLSVQPMLIFFDFCEKDSPSSGLGNIQTECLEIC